MCDTERVRLDSEFQSLCKEVQDLRRDYRKHLRSTEKCKNHVQGLIHKQAKPNEIDRLAHIMLVVKISILVFVIMEAKILLLTVHVSLLL